MKSQVIRLQTTPVITHPLPLRLNSPPLPSRHRRFAVWARRFSNPLDGLESAAGTLPAALLPVLR